MINQEAMWLKLRGSSYGEQEYPQLILWQFYVVIFLYTSVKIDFMAVLKVRSTIYPLETMNQQM